LNRGLLKSHIRSVYNAQYVLQSLLIIITVAYLTYCRKEEI